LPYEGGSDGETPEPGQRKVQEDAGATPYPKGLNQSGVTSVKSEVVPDAIGLSQGLMMITKMSFYPIVGMLFHPMYMLVNA
jgi:hypothetical protein